MTTVFVDLVLDSGDLVRVECPMEHHDELHDSITNAMRRGDWWSPSQFDGCSAQFMGMAMDLVNMGRVVGML